MARKIDSIKRRVLTSYPEWKHWNIYQKSVLIMRSSMGTISVNHMGEVDPMHPTIISYSKKLDLNEMYFQRLLDDRLMSALNDYDKAGEYRKGTRRNGSPMKRATTTEELMNVFTYETAPPTYIAINSGARKSITNSEAKMLELWEANAEQTEKVRYIDSSRKQEEYYFKKLREKEDELRNLKQKYEPTPEEPHEFELYDTYEDEDEEIL